MRKVMAPETSSPMHPTNPLLSIFSPPTPAPGQFPPPLLQPALLPLHTGPCPHCGISAPNQLQCLKVLTTLIPKGQSLMQP